MTGHLFSLAKTKDEYLLVLEVLNIHGLLLANFTAQESCVKAHLAAFRALPRSVDSYEEYDIHSGVIGWPYTVPVNCQPDSNVIDEAVSEVPGSISIGLNRPECPTGPTHSLPDPTGHS